MVLKSRGEARNEIPYCLGVYRMVDFKHGKPVYKQDGGEHFLYFQRDVRAWMVGTKMGHKFGWVRYFDWFCKKKRCKHFGFF